MKSEKREKEERKAKNENTRLPSFPSFQSSESWSDSKLSSSRLPTGAARSEGREVGLPGPSTSSQQVPKGATVENLDLFDNIFEIFKKFANFWRARSRLYQNEFLQENMRLTAFFKLYKICILLHRCDLKILAKIGLKNQQFLWEFSKKLQMLQHLIFFCKFQKCQLDNLVDFEKCWKTRVYMHRSVPIPPKTNEILSKNWQLPYPHQLAAARAPPADALDATWAAAARRRGNPNFGYSQK